MWYQYNIMDISSNAVDGIVIVIIVLIIIAAPYCCCQLSNEEYHRIVEGMKITKMKMLQK